MRSGVRIGGTFLLLCAAFAAYARWVVLPTHLPSGNGQTVSTTPTEAPDFGSATQPQPLGRGNGAWVNLYDKNSGDLYARLRAAQYTPLPEGHRYHLTRPEADFYQRDGQVVHLLADDGDVQTDDLNTQPSLAGGAPMNAPDHGTMRNVRLSLFTNSTMQDRNDPQLTVYLDNVQFDTDTCRIYTVAQNDAATGRSVAADQIPVTVRGKEMDFDGQGLLLDWNDATHDLKSLVIEHGHRLRIKSASPAPVAVSEPAKTIASPPSVPSAPSPGPVAQNQPVPAPVGQKSDSRISSVRLYIATLTGGVQVLQNGKDTVDAAEMDVTFARAGAGQPAAAANPTPATANLHVAANPNPTEKPTSTVAESPHSSVVQASQPMNGPVDVLWNGPLVILPRPSVDLELKPGEEVIHFSGAPVYVRQDNLEIAGGNAHYLTASQWARMTGVNNGPVDVIFYNGTHQPIGQVRTQRVDYFAPRRLALFSGNGTGRFFDPSHDDLLNAAWSKMCQVYLSQIGRQAQIEKAILVGDADVRDLTPDGRVKMKMTGDQIAADFARGASSTSPTLHRVVASGNANCVIHDLKSKSSDESISTDQLTIESDPGGTYPKWIAADGNVHATRDLDQLWANQLAAELAPAPGAHATSFDQSRFQLKNLLASGDVHAAGKDGQTASAEVLGIDNRSGDPLTTLLGENGGKPARLSGPNGSLRGPRIDAKPREHWAKVSGPGVIDGVQAVAPGKPPRPLHVQWQDSAEMNGDANQVNILGAVRAETFEPGGTTEAAAADRAILFLVPSAEKVKNKKSPNGQPDLMGGKQVKWISLRDHAQMASATVSPTGVLLRRSTIVSDRIDLDLPNRKLIVPQAGRMLLEDYTAAPKRSHTESSNPTSGRGETSFQWVKQFTFDDLTERAVFDGPVTIVHWPDLSGKKGTTLLADQVTADFQSSSPDAKSAAPTSDSPTALKQMTARGNVQILTSTASINATQVTYDPSTDLLLAVGTPDAPVVISDTRDRGQASCQQVWIDTQSNEITKMVGFTARARQ